MGNCKSKNRESTINKPKYQHELSQNTICTETECFPMGSTNKINLTMYPSVGSTTNDDVIDSVKDQVNSLLEGINDFDGTTEADKNYKYLDEMLTRCMLSLDTVECNNAEDRTQRKQAIIGVNQAISILERKLRFNSDIKKLAYDLTAI